MAKPNHSSVSNKPLENAPSARLRTSKPQTHVVER
jgi:hypothetical protein